MNEEFLNLGAIAGSGATDLKNPVKEQGLLRERIAQSEILGQTPLLELEALLTTFAAEPGQDFGYLGKGQEGFVVRTPGLPDETDWRGQPMAFKTFLTAQNARVMVLKMLNSHPELADKQKFASLLTELDHKVDPQPQDEEEIGLILRSAASFVIGHEIAPKLIDERVALVLMNDEPVGFLTPYAQGSIGIDVITIPGVKPVIERLERGGVLVDNANTTGNNALMLSDGNYQIIDLALEGSWEKHPRNLLPNHRRISSTCLVSAAAYQPIEDILRKTKELRDDLSRTSRGEPDYTYDDQLDGTAVVVTDGEIYTMETISKAVEKVRNDLQKMSINTANESGLTIAIDRDGSYSLRVNDDNGRVFESAMRKKKDFIRLNLGFNQADQLENMWLEYDEMTNEVQPNQPRYVVENNLPVRFLKRQSFSIGEVGKTLEFQAIREKLETSELPEELQRQLKGAASIDELSRIVLTMSTKRYQEISQSLS